MSVSPAAHIFLFGTDVCFQRRFLTAVLGREQYLASLVERAKRIQTRGRALTDEGLASVAQRPHKRVATALTRASKAARRSSLQASPSPAQAVPSGESSSPWRDEQGLSRISTAAESIQPWDIDAESDVTTLETELRHLMHQVQLLQAPDIQREDDRWLASVHSRTPVERFTLAHLCQMKASYEAERDAAGSWQVWALPQSD